MRALLASELRRNFARRLLKAVAALALAGIIIAGVSVYLTHGYPTAADLAAAAARQERVEQCVRGEIGPVAGPAPESPSDGMFPVPAVPSPFAPDRRDYCEFDPLSGVEPRPEFPEPYRYSSLDETFMGVSVPLLMLAWVLAASFAGAEWRAGTVATLLTWEPRRLRVFAAKAMAAIVIGVTLHAAVLVVLSLALLPAGLARGDMSGVDPGWVWSLAGVLARGWLLVAVGAAIGFAVGMLGRNTAAALGIGFIYLSFVDGGFLGAAIPFLRPWLFIRNAVVWVSGESQTELTAGRTPAEAALIIAAYGLGALAISAAVFRRRDVT